MLFNLFLIRSLYFVITSFIDFFYKLVAHNAAFWYKYGCETLQTKNDRIRSKRFLSFSTFAILRGYYTTSKVGPITPITPLFERGIDLYKTQISKILLGQKSGASFYPYNNHHPLIRAEDRL